MIKQRHTLRKGTRIVSLFTGIGSIVAWLWICVALNFRENLYYELYPSPLLYYTVVLGPLAIFSTLITYGLTKNLSTKETLTVMLVTVPAISIAGWWLIATLSIARYGI